MVVVSCFILIVLARGDHLTQGDPRNPAVYPPQHIELAYDHSIHVEKLKLPCVTCHASVMGSAKVSDYNIPSRESCLACHEPSAVPATWSKKARAKGNAVSIPRANLHFSHEMHLALDGVDCENCHAGVAQVVLATSEQLPSMETCLSCHDGDQAQNACTTCHLSGTRGTIRTAFRSGQLVPDDHDTSWLRGHSAPAERDMAYCASCHVQGDCISCHEGAVTPVSHDGDYLALHAQDAWFGSVACASCHRLDRFCLDCHRRAGIGPGSRRPSYGSSYHPEGWATDWVASPEHHSFVARKNIAACNSCHDGTVCSNCHRWHRGANRTHGAGWKGSARARRLRRENFDLCLRCHDPTRPEDPINDD